MMGDPVEKLPKATLVELNDVNHASYYTYYYAKWVMEKFPNEHVYGVQMGIAYGGGIERVASLWGDKGDIWGFDTFEAQHPRHLAAVSDEREATCMEHWYMPHVFGTDGLSIDYQQKVLDEANLANAHLVKGEVTEDSCSHLDRLHYAFLDMDLLVSMQIGYKAVRDRIVGDGLLLLHDVATESNLPRIYEWCRQEVLTQDLHMWHIDAVIPNSDLIVLKRRHNA